MAIDQQGSDPDTGIDQSQETGTSKSRNEPRHKRVERQRDRLYDALDMQNQKIDSLVGAVQSLVDNQNPGDQSDSNEPGGWGSLSETDLRALIMNEETSKDVRDGALLQLVDKGVKRQVKEVRNDVRSELKQTMQAQKGTDAANDVLSRTYGEDVFDTSTELGHLTAKHYANYAEKLKNKGDDIELNPEYRLVAAQLAAEHLGIHQRAESSGSGETSNDPSNITAAVSSKSGPPSADLPEGGSAAMAERISRARESLEKGTPEGNKQFLRETMQNLGFPAGRR